MCVANVSDLSHGLKMSAEKPHVSLHAEKSSSRFGGKAQVKDFFFKFFRNLQHEPQEIEMSAREVGVGGRGPSKYFMIKDKMNAGSFLNQK